MNRARMRVSFQSVRLEEPWAMERGSHPRDCFRSWSAAGHRLRVIVPGKRWSLTTNFEQYVVFLNHETTP